MQSGSPTLAADTQDQPGSERPALPPPLVRPLRHPLRWTRQHVALLAVKAIFAYIGILIVAALYYVLLETHVHLPLFNETNTEPVLIWPKPPPEPTPV